MTPAVDIEELRESIGAIPDPEVPVLTIADLGLLRSVAVEDDSVVVTITPTYSGCPAMQHIEDEIRAVLEAAGVAHRVNTTYQPAWTTEWMSADGRRKLSEYGIAPPRDGEVAVELSAPVACPHCGATTTEQISNFGSTACKALYRCLECLEPFDHFKEL